MTAKSLFDDISWVEALNVQTISTTAINTGDEDLFGYNGVEIVVVMGAIDGMSSGSPTAGTIAVKIEDAPDDGTGSAGSYSNADAVDIVGAVASAGIVKTFSESGSAIFSCSYVGDKRFIKVTLTPAGLGSGGPITVVLARHHARHRSVQATQAP